MAVTALTPSPYNPVTPVAREYVKHLKQFRDEAVSYARRSTATFPPGAGRGLKTRTTAIIWQRSPVCRRSMSAAMW